MQVSFLIVGTQKGGTTALDSYLRDHPDLCLADEKETHFFDTEAFFEQHPVDYTPFHSRFRPQPGQLLGEATPITMYWPDGARRVWEYNPRMKLICLLRNPVDRAFSHWNMERNRDAERLSFGGAIRREVERCREALPLYHRVYSYIDRGFYCEQIRRLWRYFPREQTLFLKTDDLRQRPQQALNQVCAYLEVARLAVQPRIVHARPYVEGMSPADRTFLTELYELEIRQLERLLHWDCSDWLRRESHELRLAA